MWGITDAIGIRGVLANYIVKMLFMLGSSFLHYADSP